MNNTEIITCLIIFIILAALILLVVYDRKAQIHISRIDDAILEIAEHIITYSNGCYVNSYSLPEDFEKKRRHPEYMYRYGFDADNSLIAHSPIALTRFIKSLKYYSERIRDLTKDKLIIEVFSNGELSQFDNDGNLISSGTVDRVWATLCRKTKSGAYTRSELFYITSYDCNLLSVINEFGILVTAISDTPSFVLSK